MGAATQRTGVLAFLLCALTLQCHSPPARAADASAVLRLDLSVDTILPANARLRTLFARDSIFDGPTWVRDGASAFLIFSDVPGNVIYRLSSNGKVFPFLTNIFAGGSPSAAYQSFGLGGAKKFRMLGANGITLDPQGRVVYCAYSDGRIVRLDADGRRMVLASRFAGRRLNAPNDLVYRSDGSLYFTDSRAGTKHADGEGVPHEGLYLLRAGRVVLLSSHIDHPNGVAFSPDEKYLYVTDTRRKEVLRFDVRAAGLTNETVLIDMSGDREPGAPDGIKVDKDGNVYSTGPGGVWIISPAGRHIGTVRTPTKITNMAFGGEDFKTLYMTGFGALYSMRLKAAAR